MKPNRGLVNPSLWTFLLNVGMVHGMTAPTTDQAGERLRAKREAAGHTLATAYADLRASGLPARFLPSQSTIQRMESGIAAEKKWDGVLVVALADLYGCKVSDISPTISAELESLRDLLSGSSGWLSRAA